jgi:hypothetical protein
MQIDSDKTIDLQFITSYLTNTWQDILKHDAFNPNEDLYSVGAHSLAVIQALDSTIRQFELVDLDTTEFFNRVEISYWAKLLFDEVRHRELRIVQI